MYLDNYKSYLRFIYHIRMSNQNVNTNIKETKNIVELYQGQYQDDLINLFQMPFGRNEARAIIERLVEKRYDDKRIYVLLNELYQRKENSEKYNPEEESRRRANKTGNIIKDFLKNIHISRDYVKHYLDIGCEDCHMPLAIGRILNAKKVSCINIEDWESDYSLDKKQLERCNFQYYDGINIPYASNSVQFISMIMVIHHVDKLKLLMEDVARVLVSGGYLLIKEHNCPNREFAKLIDVQHYIYDAIYFGKYIDKYNTRYYTLNELREILENLGFQMIKIKEIRNITRSYYALYRISK